MNGDASDGPVRIGVLGAARIAEAFVAAVRGSTALEVTAIASRDLDRAARFAQAHGIARALGSYEALLADPA
ncbi:MAG: gfo/Idh/MocA family oxidoreductase, partial [Deltaproteobacteria bacterium]|nr:gfo/Idh/MocA family oxidoreductase [Deltaproteobacteria bacterium]